MSEGSELNFNMQNREPQRNTEENRKLLPLIATDDADQESQNHRGHREMPRGTSALFSIDAINTFGLQFFCHFAEGLHNQLWLVKMNPVRAFFRNEMFAAQ